MLDLFAGSGSLGFEALSRGAAHAVFVESGRTQLKLLDRNTEELGVRERVTMLGDTIGALSATSAKLAKFGPFEVVLADPPYEEGWETRLLSELDWESVLAPDGYFCLEWGTLKSEVSELPEAAGVLVKVREKNYGDSVLTTYQRRG